ncbi:MAG: alpha-L-fucosidase [Akkermansiaceae bacterium]|nr:alpha-L-fucosidase [Akkermansiaceae bacterium]
MHMFRACSILAALPLLLTAPRARAADETPAAENERMAWWREAKFGMFIHWGVYAVPAGTYDGKQIPGIGEWIMLRAKIPVDTYRGYAKDFNPVNYKPDEWAALAKDAGMRYMVITSKHHDGFALFPSEVTDWDVADATPWGKDLIGPLADAAREKGLKFGLYYSQAQDWTHPGGAKAGMDDGSGWDDAHKGSFDNYLDKIAVPQTREILTRYQPDILWWDTPHLMNPQRAEKLADLLPLRPGIITNNRLGGGHHGDTETPEQHIPARGFPGRDWETCMTMNDTWGFKSYDHHWKGRETLIRNLIDIASKGGNYLLNVGPDATGRIPEESVKLLHQVGDWMKTNGESIYGTHGSPLPKLAWGRCTMKDAGDNTELFLHVFDWPEDGSLLVPALKNQVVTANLLAGGTTVAAETTDDGVVLKLPGGAPDAVSSTVKLVVSGKPEIGEVAVLPAGNGTIRLDAESASLHGQQLRIESADKASNIGYWNNPSESVAWTMKVKTPGKHLVRIITAAPTDGSVLRIEGAGKLAFPVPNTGGFRNYKESDVGELELPAGKQELRLHAVADGWKPVNVRSVELIPQR